jgi:hypothetical protein
MRGKDLKKFREVSGATQNILSELLNVSLRTIQIWEAKDELSDAALKKLKRTFIEIAENEKERNMSVFSFIELNIKGGEYLNEDLNNTNINISGNKAGRDQNFLNDYKDSIKNAPLGRYGETTPEAQSRIDELEAENKALREKLDQCKDDLIQELRKK